MKKNGLVFTFNMILCFTVLSCSSGNDGEEPSESTQRHPVEQLNPPGKAVGVLPENGEPCSEYEEVVGDETKVLVDFRWNAASLAQNYILIITEGSNEVFRNSLSELQTQVVLDRGQAYTWMVVSVNNDGQTIGDTFSFTTPGTPTNNFAPYAAEISTEFEPSTSEVAISWVGSDEDGDILTYDVAVSEEGVLIFESVNLTETTVDPIAIDSNVEYTIEVISRDSSGNFSISQITTSFAD